MRTLFCNSIYGAGGIGQHFRHLVEESRRNGILDCYYAYGARPQDSKGIVVEKRTFGLVRYTPLRWFPSWKSHIVNELFDRDVANRLPSVERSIVGGSLMGFAGKSLRTFRKAGRLGASRLELVAPNSHVQNVSRLHARAAADCGLADSWLNQAQVRKTLREYALADRIYVHSEYVRQSFLDAGIPDEQLVRTTLRPDPRFVPPQHRPEGDTFRIAYVGRVEMTKGIALLLDAFDRLPIQNAELRIVGGWSNRSVRRRLQTRMRKDPRITVQPGDPLPILQKADVFVHPSYEDGFGYAPMEALACGVPVVVTEDTGMKEYVRDGVNGFVIPTGSVDAIVAALERLARNPLACCSSILSDSLDSALLA